MPNEAIQASQQFFRTLAAQAAAFLPNLAVALIILAAGLLVAGWAARLVSATGRSAAHVDPTVLGPLAAIVRYVVIILAVIAALGQVGVQTTSLLAALGAAGLAVGLALQGTLTNIAAGIMLLWLRPFRIGDYVEAQNVAGTVRDIGLFVCHLETFDGVFVFVPNSGLWNVWLRNHTRAAPRLVAFSVKLPRGLDAEGARDALARAAGEAGLSGAAVSLDALDADAQSLVVRGHVAAGSLSEALHALPERIREGLAARFGENGAPRAIQRLVPGDADPARFGG